MGDELSTAFIEVLNSILDTVKRKVPGSRSTGHLVTVLSFVTDKPGLPSHPGLGKRGNI